MNYLQLRDFGTLHISVFVDSVRMLLAGRMPVVKLPELDVVTLDSSYQHHWVDSYYFQTGSIRSNLIDLLTRASFLPFFTCLMINFETQSKSQIMSFSSLWSLFFVQVFARLIWLEPNYTLQPSHIYLFRFCFVFTLLLLLLFLFEGTFQNKQTIDSVTKRNCSSNGRYTEKSLPIFYTFTSKPAVKMSSNPRQIVCAD